MGKEIKGLVDQISPSVLVEGNPENIRIGKMGEIFTVDWVQRLALAGRVYTLNLGSIGGDGSYTALIGNATAVDNNQPEVIIAIDTGWLVPIEIDIGFSVTNLAAYDDWLDLLFIGDRSQTVAAGETGTIETALNMLDGGAAFDGRCYSIINTDNIPNPVTSDVLGYKYWEITKVAAEVLGSVPSTFNYYKYFDTPRFLAGPCSIIGFVCGKVAPTFMGSITFAHLPASWVVLS